ncbi:MAG: hypothetical protein Fur0032_17410 [Terrimicrobiaceae bacterium]
MVVHDLFLRVKIDWQTESRKGASPKVAEDECIEREAGGMTALPVGAFGDARVPGKPEAMWVKVPPVELDRSRPKVVPGKRGGAKAGQLCRRVRSGKRTG